MDKPTKTTPTRTPNRSKGRPAIFGAKMKQTAIWLPEDMIAWLHDQQPQSVSEVVRQLIRQQMTR